MSGIYIPGMEIPDDCLHCPCADLEYMDCNLMPGSGIGYKKRLDDCPLIPVPEHGRLIDGDELEDVHRKGADKGDSAWKFHVTAKAWVREMPTIIPADKEVE